MGRTRCAGRHVGTPALCSGRVAPLLAGVWCTALFALSGPGAITYYLMKRDPALLARRMHGGPLAEKEQSQRLIMYDRNGAGVVRSYSAKQASARPAGRTAAARPRAPPGPARERSPLPPQSSPRDARAGCDTSRDGWVRPMVLRSSVSQIPMLQRIMTLGGAYGTGAHSLRLDALHGRRPPPSHRGR